MYPYVRYVRNRASPLAKVNPFRALSGRGLQGFLRGYNLWPGSAAMDLRTAIGYPSSQHPRWRMFVHNNG